MCGEGPIPASNIMHTQPLEPKTTQVKGITPWGILYFSLLNQLKWGIFFTVLKQHWCKGAFSNQSLEHAGKW